MSDVVTLAVAERVATITLNRPEARNALSRGLLVVSNDQTGVRRILRTYAENERLAGADAWRNETTVSDAWFADLANRPGEVEARRQAVMERGRQQTSGDR